MIDIFLDKCADVAIDINVTDDCRLFLANHLIGGSVSYYILNIKNLWRLLAMQKTSTFGYKSSRSENHPNSYRVGVNAIKS